MMDCSLPCTVGNRVKEPRAKQSRPADTAKCSGGRSTPISTWINKVAIPQYKKNILLQVKGMYSEFYLSKSAKHVAIKIYFQLLFVFNEKNEKNNN